MFKLMHFSNGSWGNESDVASEASQWNFTKTIQTKLEDIEIDANFAWLLFSLVLAMVWFTYITHYSARFVKSKFLTLNSTQPHMDFDCRITGQILTRLLNRFALGSGYIKIGKFCVLYNYKRNSLLKCAYQVH